jgi:uncharacterized protein YjbJ (UPF0337 family)
VRGATPRENAGGGRVWARACIYWECHHTGAECARLRRLEMKASTKDQTQGKFHQAKGSVKEKAGKMTNDPDLAMRGRDEKTSGKVQNKVGQVEKVFEK